MKLSFFKYILFLSLLNIISCNDTPLTINQNTPLVKSETKWKISINDESKQFKIYSKEYNRNGKVNSITEYLQTGDFKCISVFNYSNNISYEEIKYYNGDNFIDSILQNIYIYFSTGKISRKIVISENGDTNAIVDYSYDKNGNLIKKIQTDYITNNSIVTNFEYLYNSNGNVVGRLVNPNLNGTYDSRDSIAYQSGGVKVELYNYGQDGRINIIYTYFYNKYGLIHKEYHSTKDGKISEKYEYSYNYWN